MGRESNAIKKVNDNQANVQYVDSHENAQDIHDSDNKIFKEI